MNQEPKLAAIIKKFIKDLPNLAPGKIPQWTQQDLEEALKDCSNNSSPGPDGISYRLVKILPAAAKTHMVAIFNSILKKRYYPSAWKIANITMLPKPGKPPSDPSNYRPISLLPALGNFLERMLLPLSINKLSILHCLFQFLICYVPQNRWRGDISPIT